MCPPQTNRPPTKEELAQLDQLERSQVVQSSPTPKTQQGKR